MLEFGFVFDLHVGVYGMGWSGLAALASYSCELMQYCVVMCLRYASFSLA